MQMVPSEDPKLLGSPLGYLMNELCYAPENLLEHTISLVQLSISLDVGNCVSDSTTSIILHVLRFASKIDSYLSFLISENSLESGGASYNSCHKNFRQWDFGPSSQVLQVLIDFQSRLRQLLWGPMLSVIYSWIRQLRKICEPLTRNALEEVEELILAMLSNIPYVDQPKTKEEYMKEAAETLLVQHTARLCSLYAHILVLFRNVKHEDLDEKKVSLILEAHFFLAKRFSWATPEDQMFYKALQDWWGGFSENPHHESKPFCYPDLTSAIEICKKNQFFFGFDLQKEKKIKKNNIVETIEGKETDEWLPESLNLPKSTIFDCWQFNRRLVVNWLRSQNKGTLSQIFTRCVRISSGLGPDEPQQSRFSLSRNEWALFQEESSRGRFFEISLKIDQNDPDKWKQEMPSTTNDLQEHGVELDLQILLVTLNSSSIQSLPNEVVLNENVQEILGSEVSQKGESNLQTVLIENCENRVWYRIIGRNYDVQHWRTPDLRVDNSTPIVVEAFDRFYDPTDLYSTERWIIPIFEPVRKVFMMGPPPWDLRMQAKRLSKEASVAYIIHVNKDGCLKEILVYKYLKMVHIFDIIPNGRRFYRCLILSTDHRFCFHEMQSSLSNKSSYWSPWSRFLANTEIDPLTNDNGCLILKGKGHDENWSGETETYVPPINLRGLLPHVLLETHHFWQDQYDNLKGYPKMTHTHNSEQPNELNRDYEKFLYVHLHCLKKVECTQNPGVCARIYRMSRETAFHKWSRFNPIRPQHTNSRLKGISLQMNNSYQPPNDLIQDENETVSLLEPDFKLLDILHAVPGSQLWALGQLFSRLENLSYILAWAKVHEKDTKFSNVGHHTTNVDLVELPRLNLAFQAKIVHLEGSRTEIRFYSIDHVDLFITNERSDLIVHLMRGIPHSLLLSNQNGDLQLLVPVLKIVRPNISDSPYSTTILFDR
jgi:hypothetical protein